MSFNINTKVFLTALVFGCFQVQAQEEDEKIKEENVVVEFSFNPTLSDVFKYKTSPTSEQNFSKQEITYKVNSKPVASDFVPIAKKAIYVPIEKSNKQQYNNYIYGGVGLYGNGEFEAMVRPVLKNNYLFGVDVSSYNVQNGVDEERVDNGQWKTNLELFLSNENRRYNWQANAAYERNQIHWYGLDELVDVNNNTSNVQQVYNTIAFSGVVNYKNSYVKSLQPSIQFFSDQFQGSEIDINVYTDFDKVLLNDKIATRVDFEYLNGSFGENNTGYSFLNFGLTPSYQYKANDFVLSVALGLFVNRNMESSKTNFIFLPDVKAEVGLVENIMTLYGGIRSELKQNSYASLVENNPFVSPNLSIKTSYTPVDVYAGLKGNLSKTISYNGEISYKQTNDEFFFIHNSALAVATKPYELGNSFNVVYDDVQQLSINAGVEVEVLEELKTGVLAIVNNYKTDTLQEAYNLPSFVLETYANYQIDNWFAQAGIHFVSQRKEFVAGVDEDIDGFVDVNVKGGYRINSKMNVHLNIYNLLNNDYQTFRNYQVQGFQALAGVSYKF